MIKDSVPRAKRRNPEQYALGEITLWSKEQAREASSDDASYAWRLVSLWAPVAMTLHGLKNALIKERSAKETMLAHFKKTLKGVSGEMAIAGVEEKIKVYSLALQRIEREIKDIPIVRTTGRSIMRQMKNPVTDDDEAQV